MHTIRANKRDGGNRPPVTVKTYNSNRYAQEVIIKGPAKVIHRPNKPLSCGARVWIETDAEVELIGEQEWKDIKNY